MDRCFLASLLVLFLNLASLLPSLACPYCPYPIPSPPKVKPPSPPKVKPPPPPPKVKLPPPPPKIKPPPPPKVLPPPPPKVYPPPPRVLPPPPPKVYPPPPRVLPPPPPKVYPPPPQVLPPPPPKVYPPPPQVPYPPPPFARTCPINTLKLDACVDLLGSLVHIVIGSGATGTCCPVLEGLTDLDAALCLCTTIKAKLLNINIILPIALEVLVDCGKHLPSDFQCPA